jgi:signal transduction histidine kinase
LQQRGGDEYTQAKLGLVSGQLQRIRNTLRELTAFGRPSGTVRGRVALADVLGEALGIAKYYQRTRRRIAAPELPPDLPPLVGVRDQLVQVFLNLVLNAIDAAGKAGHVELAVERRPGGVEVAVRDDGPGIAPEDQARLFQPFFTTKPHGTGLGLFVTRRLVAAHGGTVACESRPGTGTTFRVFLPVEERAARTQPASEAVPRAEGVAW